MKYSVSSYSYSQLRHSGAYTEPELIALAKEMGFDGIEFAEINTPDGKDKAEYAAELKAEADRVGIEIFNYAVGSNLVYESEEEFRKITDEVKKQLDIAKILGVKIFRHDATFDLKGEKSFDLALPKLVRCIREITEYAQTLGIRTMIENHGYICQDSDRVERLYNAVNHENFGLLVDMGNFACVDEDCALAVSRVGRYAFHLHAKDFLFKSYYEADDENEFFPTRACNKLRGAIIGNGIVPVKQCIAIMQRHGYTGNIALEFEGKEDCIYGIETGLAVLKRYIKELDMK